MFIFAVWLDIKNTPESWRFKKSMKRYVIYDMAGNISLQTSHFGTFYHHNNVIIFMMMNCMRYKSSQNSPFIYDDRPCVCVWRKMWRKTEDKAKMFLSTLLFAPLLILLNIHESGFDMILVWFYWWDEWMWCHICPSFVGNYAIYSGDTVIICLLNGRFLIWRLHFSFNVSLPVSRKIAISLIHGNLRHVSYLNSFIFPITYGTIFFVV